MAVYIERSSDSSAASTVRSVEFSNNRGKEDFSEASCPFHQ